MPDGAAGGNTPNAATASLACRMLIFIAERAMTRAIAAGMFGLALFCNTVNAQTPVERAQILREFQDSVADYAQHHHCLSPSAMTAATPAPRIFTLPVAMVFRQLIADAMADNAETLIKTLPVLPAPLEYRMIGDDLAILDADANTTVAVLRDAVAISTRHFR